MLLLFPAAFLIVLLLGSVAVDSGIAFMRQRELASAVGAAANDAVMLGLDPAALRGDGRAVLDPGLVRVAVERSLERRGVLDTLVEPPHIEIVDGTQLRLSLVAQVDYLIAPALPGAPDGRTVRATVTAVASATPPHAVP